MNSTRCKRLCGCLLALVLTLLLQTSALAVSMTEIDAPITVQQWAAMLCGACLDSPTKTAAWPSHTAGAGCPLPL